MVFKESGGKTSCRQQIEYKSYQAVQKLTANVWGRNERTIEPWEGGQIATHPSAKNQDRFLSSRTMDHSIRHMLSREHVAATCYWCSMHIYTGKSSSNSD